MRSQVNPRAQGCGVSPSRRNSGGSGRSSLGGGQGQCGGTDTDSDSFQGPMQYSNRSSILLLLGKVHVSLCACVGL